MGVERQVVGGEVDVVLEQRPQALGQQRRQPGRVEVPEQPVVDEHELRAELDRALDQLALRGDAGDHARDLRARPGTWSPFGPRSWNVAGCQQLVERPNDVGDLRHGFERRDSLGDLQLTMSARPVFRRPVDGV